MNTPAAVKLQKAISLLRASNMPPNSPARQAEMYLLSLQLDIGFGELPPERQEGEQWGEYHKRIKELRRDKVGYDICLVDPVTKHLLKHSDKHNIQGGTYAAGGTRNLELSITYNYAPFFRKYIGERGIRTIYDMTAAESIPILKKAIDKMADDTTEDYWEATEGNAKKALQNVVALAEMRPDGIWEGD